MKVASVASVFGREPVVTPELDGRVATPEMPKKPTLLIVPSKPTDAPLKVSAPEVELIVVAPPVNVSVDDAVTLTTSSVSTTPSASVIFRTCSNKSLLRRTFRLVTKKGLVQWSKYKRSVTDSRHIGCCCGAVEEMKAAGAKASR